MFRMIAPAFSSDMGQDSASQFLVPPEPTREKFGLQEIVAAFLFALFVAGVSFIQFRGNRAEMAMIESKVRELPKTMSVQEDALKASESIGKLFQAPPAHRAAGEFELYFVFGACVFFLTASVLFFFNHGINKISFFMAGVTKRIVYIYLSAMAAIFLILHMVPPEKQIIAMHAMLIAVCAADTWINRIISENFRRLSESYREIAKIFRLAMGASLAMLALNAYVVIQEIVWEKTGVSLPIISPYHWNLVLLVAIQFMSMLLLRDLVREGRARILLEQIRYTLPRLPGYVPERMEAHV